MKLYHSVLDLALELYSIFLQSIMLISEAVIHLFSLLCSISWNDFATIYLDVVLLFLPFNFPLE